MPSPKLWTGEAAYSFVFGNMLHIVCGSYIALAIGSFINTYLISKWKVLVRGKYFWLRSIGASVIGEGIYTVAAGLLIYIGRVPFDKMVDFIMWSYIFKIVGSIILATPANLIASYLKKKEEIGSSDKTTNFNPFKIST